MTVQMKLKKLYPSFMLFLMASGYAGLMLASSLPLLIISIILSGLGTGLAFPFIMSQASQYAQEDNSIIIMGIVSSCAFLGQFFSPLILDNIPNITGNSISTIFATLALTTSIILVVSLIRSMYQSNINQKCLNQEND